MDEPIFLGSESEKVQYFRKHGIKLSEPEEEKEQEKPKNRSVVTENNLEPLSEDIRLILERTRLRHDPEVVYMQSNIDFYDHFYTSEDDSELAKEAQQIRRLYKSYPAFLHASRVRDQYIDHLIDDFYGGDPDAFIRGIRSGEVDWLPPVPIYSTKSPDYELSKLGIVQTSNKPDGQMDEEMAARIHKIVLEEAGIDLDNPEEVGVMLTVETDLKARKLIGEAWDDTNQFEYRSVNSTDMESLQKVLSHWYQQDEGEALSKDQRLFRLTKDEIIRRYNESQLVNMKGDMDLALKGELKEVNDNVDMNQMVNDPKTGRPMTRKELEGRKLVRLFAANGWHELKLMKQMNVGTSFERTQLAKASRNRRKNKLIASSVMEDIGMTMSGTVPYRDDDDYDPIAALERSCYNDDEWGNK